MLKPVTLGTSLEAPWLRIRLPMGSNPGIMGSIPGFTGFDPRSRKIPHAAEQLSPCTTTTEPAL